MVSISRTISAIPASVGHFSDNELPDPAIAVRKNAQ
jgi:hypothetical protein